MAGWNGHAKNFSLFLRPGGRFRLAPLYDVMSAQPACDDHQLQRNKMKLALAAGNNRHYVVDSLMPRHFVQTAAANGIPERTVRAIFEELFERQDIAIENVTNELPVDFPEALVRSVTNGLHRRLRLWEP